MYEIKLDMRGDETEVSLIRRTRRGNRVAVPGSKVKRPKGEKFTVEDIETVLLPYAARLLGDKTSNGTG